LSTLTFIIFTLCFAAILVVNPLFLWSDFNDWVRFSQENNQFFKHLAQLMMLLFGSLFVIVVNCIHDYTNEGKKVLSRIGLSFALLFAIATGIHYFLQISIVRLSLAAGQIEGLEQFIQANPYAAVAGINMLGWTLFLGLSCLFLAPVFDDGGLERVIRYALLANGIIVTLGGIGFIFDATILVFGTMNLGMGAALLILSIALAFWFKRLNRDATITMD
jgi:hypothetical protein